MNSKFLFSFLFLALIWGCKDSNPQEPADSKTKTEANHDHSSHEHDTHGKTKSTLDTQTLLYPGETHLKNMKQLTFGGDNAEAYFSFDNKNLVFQASYDKWGTACDQIFMMPATGYTGEKPPMLSTGKGRTTCSYFMPGNKEIIYSSTHLGNEACPNAPRTVNGKYVWAIFKDFDIFVADLDGNIKKQLTHSPGYDAEPTISPDG